MANTSSNDRQIVLDTETTGLDPKQGDRIVEIGCVEIVDLVPTGQTYQAYINPERPMSAGAAEITGLSDGFLQDFPVFAQVAQAFARFIGEAPLIIHNAPFDVGFINAEFARLGMPALNSARIIDTLNIARRKFPGQSNSLDALCKRLGVNNTNRTLHGALLDAEILAEVYGELSGGRQRGLGLMQEAPKTGAGARAAQALAADLRPTGVQRPARPHGPSEAERAAHAHFLEKSIPQAIWKRDS